MRKLIVLIALFSGGSVAQPAATGQFLLRIEPTRAGFTLQNMSPEEASLASRHARYLKSLLDIGKLSLAAQVFDPKGLWGIVIVNAPDRETARALLDADPMVKANLFRGEVIPVRVVFEKQSQAAPPSSALSKEFEGQWEGALNAGGNTLRIGMKLSPAADGTAKADLVSIDQDNAAFSADSVNINGKELQFGVRMINGSYKGTLGAGGEIAGEWKQAGNTLPLTFRRPGPVNKP
jgi:uncharacterized protein YciI